MGKMDGWRMCSIGGERKEVKGVMKNMKREEGGGVGGETELQLR